MTTPPPVQPFVVARDGGPGLDRLQGAVVAIGNFDGVHLGHRAVIAAALGRARTAGRPAAALTFEPHPRSFFQPDAASLPRARQGRMKGPGDWPGPIQGEPYKDRLKNP